MSSLQERLAARRQALQAARYVNLSIPGYEDMLIARYRILGLQELKAIAQRNAEISADESDLVNAADTLVDACEELLEVKSASEYTSTGYKWSAAAARDLFGAQLAEDASPRDAILQIFPPTQTELLTHFLEYDSHVPASAKEIDKEIRGNSSARSAPEKQSISQ